MKILHITRDLAPRTLGGMSTAVAALARAQARAGHDVKILSFDRWRPKVREVASDPPVAAEEGPLTVMRLGAPDQLPAATAFALGFEPDVLHAHHAMLWPFTEALRHTRPTPTAYSVHVLQARQDELRELEEPTMSARAEARAFEVAEAIVAPSRAAALGVRVMNPPWGAKCHVVPLGLEDHDAARAAVEARRPDAPLGPLLYAGRFADVHGTAELLTALPALLTAAPGVTAVVAGGLPDGAKAQRRWLERWRDGAPMELQHRVTFTGWLEADALSERYAEASILLAPSLYETFGMSAAEAQLHGLAVIASRTGGLPEVVEDGVTGVLVHPGDVEGLVEATLALLQDPARIYALGQAGAQAVRQRLNPDASARAVDAVYRQITGAGPA